ncbi:MAG: diacylglycerol kinase family protein [Chloroflexota bacterium]
MSYTRIIVNPAAGAGKTAQKWPAIRALLQSRGLRFEYRLTEAPGHAVELAREAAKDGHESLVCVGGDGTVHEVVNGWYHPGNGAGMTLGIIPTGTGGDYARTLGLSRRYEDACCRLFQPRKLAVDIGVVEYGQGDKTARRCFVNFAGAGIDAEIVRRTSRRYKLLGGTGSYLAGLLSALVAYRNRDVTLTVDGETLAQRACAVIVNNGRYGGGGMRTAPEADPADGSLDVLVIGDLTKPDLLCSLPRIYRGTHLTHPKVTMLRGQEVTLTAEPPLPLQADGELLGRTPARFSLVPGALSVLV